MKHVLLMMAMMLAVGCGKDKRLVKEKPLSDLVEIIKDEKALRDMVVGGYLGNHFDSETRKMVFLNNGTVELYDNDKKLPDGSKWRIVDEEIYLEHSSELINVYRIDKDGGITAIADIVKGKRTDWPEETAFKKIK